MKLNSILVCVDPERTRLNLIERAADIANNSGAAIKLVQVVSGYPEDLSEWWNVRNPKKLQDKIVREKEGFLANLAARLKEQGVEEVSYELKWGRPFIEMTKEVIKHRHDLAMITAQRPSKLGQLLHERPAMDLLRHCPCTLWLSKGRKAPKRHKRVLAALGWKGRQVVCDAQNAKIVRTATALAASNGSELHYIHALPLYGGQGRKGNKLRADLVGYMDELRDEIEEHCGPIVAEQGVELKKEHVHLVTGAPEVVIADFVHEAGIDVVVMGTVARTGIPGLLVGNTAEKVFAQVDCPIVAVKPGDFVSAFECERADEKLQEKQEELTLVEKQLQEKQEKLALLEKQLADKEENRALVEESDEPKKKPETADEEPTSAG